MNLSSISDNFAEVITKELDYNIEKKEIIAYAIQTAILFILGTLLIVLLGYTFNALMPAIFAATFGSLLRRVSGGAHFNSPLKCLSFGSLAYSLIGLFSQKLIDYALNNKFAIAFILINSLIIVSLLAPVESENKPIHSKSLKYKLKALAISFVIVSSFIIFYTTSTLLSVSAALGVFYQSVTLLPIFNRKGGVNGL